MAKPTVYKVSERLKLTDLWYAKKVDDGDKVCFVVPKRKNGKKKKRWGFVKGTLRIFYRTYCECCGPEFHAWVEDNSGKKLFEWR